MNTTIFGQRFNAQGQALKTHHVTDTFFSSGIKVLDVYAPIPWGGFIGVIAQNGVGKLVVLMELVERMARCYGGRTILVSSTTAHGQDLEYSLLEAGVEPHIAHIVVQEPSDNQAALHTATTMLQRHANQPMLCIIDGDCLGEQPAHILEELRPQLSASHIVILFDHQEPSDLQQLQLDGYIYFSKALAQQQIWPAIDPQRSISRVLEQAEWAEQAQLVDRLRQTLEYNTTTALSILQFGAQPFFTAELFTAKPGTIVPLQEALVNYLALLEA